MAIDSRAPQLVRIISIIYILLIVPIFLVLYALGYDNLAGGGLIILGLPIILVSIIAIRKTNLFKTFNHYDYSFVSKPKILLFNLFFILLYALSINTALFARNCVYLLLISLMTYLLISDIIYKKIYNYFYGIFLIKSILILLNLSLTYTLKHPISIFSTDVFFHFRFINLILDNSYITAELGGYQYFPLYHIYYAMTFLITDSINWSMFYFFSALLFSTSVLAIYLLSSRITKDGRCALLASLIYIFIPTILSDSMYTITRTMDYIILMNITYMIFREKTEIRNTVLTIFLIIPAILTHNTTFVFFLGLFLLYLFLDITIVRVNKIKPIFISLFAALFISYLLYITPSLFDSWMNVLIGIREPIIIGPGASESSGESYGQYYFFQNIFLNINYTILVFFSLVGSYSYLIRNRNLSIAGNIVVLTSILVLPFQVPIVSGHLASLLGYRIPSILAHLAALSASAGFLYLFGCHFINKFRYVRTLWILLLLLFCIQSSALVGKQIESNMFPDIYGQYNRNYFIDSEIDSFDFCNKYFSNDTTIYTDYWASRYLKACTNMKSSSSAEGPDLKIPANAAFILRSDEYKSFGKLPFLAGAITGRGFGGSNMVFMDYQRNSHFQNIWSQGNLLYASNDVNIYSRIH